MNHLPPSEEGKPFPAEEYEIGARAELLKNWTRIQTSYDLSDSRVKNLTFRLRQTLDIPPNLLERALLAAKKIVGWKEVKVSVSYAYLIIHSENGRYRLWEEEYGKHLAYVDGREDNAFEEYLNKLPDDFLQDIENDREDDTKWGFGGFVALRVTIYASG